MLRSGKKFLSKKLLNDDESDDEETNLNEFEVVNNDIYFYCNVTKESALKLNTTIKKLEIELLILGIKFGLADIPIKIHINSDGGEISAALSVVDTIINSKVEIISIIEGIACSAATLISIVCNHRIIYENANMMIHQLSCNGLWGKMNEIEDEFQNLKSTMKVLKKIYSDYSKINYKELNDLLKKDINWNSKKCLKLGLIDEIN